MTEKRYTDPATGGEKGQKDARFGGGDPLALIELAKVYGMGEGKYARYNYLKGYPWSLSVDALYRHLFAFLSGEERDPESGLLHTAHVAWHALTLTSFQQRAVGTDDRAPSLPDKWGELEISRADVVGDFVDISLQYGPCVCHTPGIEVGPQHVEAVKSGTAVRDPLLYEKALLKNFLSASTKVGYARCDHGVPINIHCDVCTADAQ